MKLYLGFIVLLTTLVVSCGEEDVIFEKNEELSGQTWSRSDTKEFEFDISDTLQQMDFYFNLRTTASYPYSNLYLFAELEAPTIGDKPGLISYDTIDIPLADLTGQWKGKVSGSMVENNVQFMTKVRLRDVGKYKLSFTQGMRDQDLSEIVDVGLTIKESVEN